MIGQIDDFRRGFLGKKAQKAGKKGGMVIKKLILSSKRRISQTERLVVSLKHEKRMVSR